MKILQDQLHGQIDKEVEWKMKLLRQKDFEMANKPGKFLAW